MVLISNITIFHQKDLSDELIDKIAYLKKQAWSYPFEEQVRYLKNLLPGDQHFLSFHGQDVIGYLRLTERKAKAAQENFRAAGISTVCVDKHYRRKGFGRALVKEATVYIGRKHFDFGLLFCPERFEDFYKRCGWQRTSYQFYQKDFRGSVSPAVKEDHRILIYPEVRLGEDRVEIFGDLF